MIDLHTHILPNIDDGAANVDESQKLLDALLKQNISIVICTPHYNPAKTSISDFINKRTEAMEQLKNTKLDLVCGSETLFHEYLFHYTDICGLCIEGTKYLLLELPYLINWESNIFERIERLITYFDVIPIIAHVERYKATKGNEKCIKRLKAMGCLMQLNTSSISNIKTRGLAIRYVKHGFIDVLGSDCHNMKTRPPIIKDAYQLIKKKLGVEYCNELMQNAEYIVKGVDIRKL
jgi:protein-tyrosine phosphatase